MRPAALALVLALAPLAAGCAGPYCVEQPGYGHFELRWEGNATSLQQQFRGMGWALETGNRLGFDGERGVNGTLYRLGVGYGAIDPVGNATASVSGGLPWDATVPQLRAGIAPIIDPMAARWNASVSYETGSRVCSR